MRCHALLREKQNDSCMVNNSFLEPVCNTMKRHRSWRADRAPGLAGPVRLLLGGEDSPADFSRSQAFAWNGFVVTL
jgi:hypothetical protein